MTSLHFLCFALLGFFVHAKEKITTPHFTILFDKSATESARRIANTLETVYKPVAHTLGVYPSPIRLVINNKSTELNAYFKPIPRHISFYTLYHPDPNFIGNGDWLNMLCIHEFRHAVQHSIEYHSTPFWLRPLYFAANLISICGVNSFFKEGDAVGMETALSKSGRGRLPGWEKIYKVNLLERSAVSFSRQLFGSLKHEMPSEYHLGYYFTTHIRRKYGTNAIQSIFEHTMRGIPYFGFCNAIKKVTKKSILKVYKDINEELSLSWQKQLEGLKITPATQLTMKQPNDSLDYIHPFIDASGNLLAWKRGIGLRDQLVQVRVAPAVPTASKKVASSCRKDKTIFYFIHDGSLPPAAFATGEGSAAWLERYRHPWQGNKQTIRLQYYNFKQRKRRTLVSSSRYIALAMSPSTHQLVAVTSDETGNHLLVVLDTKSGKVVKKIDHPDTGYYLTPSWSDEDHIVVVKTKDQQNSIVRINVATSKTEILLPYTYEHRSYPRIYKDYLLYNSSYNGIDNIYAMHLPTKACFQVTSRKYGAYLGMVDPINDQLIFNDYTKNGMDIAVMPFDPLVWTPLGEVEDRSVGYYKPLVVQEQNSDILTKVPNHLYPLTKYHFVKDSLAFIGITVAPHSGSNGLKIEPFSLVNLADTLQTTPYFYHNFNRYEPVGMKHHTSGLGLKVNFTTWYPIFEVDIKYARYYCNEWYIEKGTFSPSRVILKNIPKIAWTPELNIGIKLPYYFTLGSSSGEAYLNAGIELKQCDDQSKKIGYIKKYSFTIKNSSTKSKRDMHGPWSQELDMHVEDAKKSPDLLIGHENITSFNTRWYIPGIGNHHYFSFNPTIRRFKAPKNEPYSTHVLKWVYGFPLAYPECGLPLIWFLEKIWMEGYYHTKPRKINQTDHANLALSYQRDPKLDTIGAKICCSSRFLVNTNIPFLTVSIDFDFLKKYQNGWVFQFPLPKFSFNLEPRP